MSQRNSATVIVTLDTALTPEQQEKIQKAVDKVANRIGVSVDVIAGSPSGRNQQYRPGHVMTHEHLTDQQRAEIYDAAVAVELA